MNLEKWCEEKYRKAMEDHEWIDADNYRQMMELWERRCKEHNDKQQDMFSKND